MRKDKIFAVTVTYGRRWHLLQQVIKAALSEGLDKIIIVNNGANQDIAGLSSAEFDSSQVEVITLPNNTGSAGGFRVGLQHANEQNPDYILLLDDDNQLQAGALDILYRFYLREVSTSSSDSLAVLAFRPTRYANVSNKITASRVNARRGSYFSFHIMDIPFKLWKRLPLAKNSLAHMESGQRLLLNIAPWSGLLFNRDLIQKHGYPDANLILYADDTEYSLRITREGGRIVLCTEAMVNDLDESWNLNSVYSNSFDGLLLGEGDFRAYYSTRNNNYLEYYCNPYKGILHTLNRWMFVTVLTIRALVLKRLARLRLLLLAMKDGKEKRLGVNNKFPL